MRVARAGNVAEIAAGIAAVVITGAPGCVRTFRGEAVQPNPVAASSETQRSSEKITIVTGDMELEMPYAPDASQRVAVARNARYPLVNQASFTVVSRDRLRFHVQIDHKWEDWADPSTWHVHLEDDQGHRWEPASIEHVRTLLINQVWDREQRTAVCSSAGRDASGACITTVGVLDDGWKHRQTFGTLSVFRGRADFVFYDRDLMRSDVARLRLVVERPTEAFVFAWRFTDAVAAH